MNKVLTSRIIYPGLFHPTGIEFDLSADAIVSITITSPIGEIFTMLVNKRPYSKGTHEVLFTAPPKETGELYYQIVAEFADETVTERKKLR